MPKDVRGWMIWLVSVVVVVALLSWLFLFVPAASAAEAHSATYCVDAANGDDAAAGTSALGDCIDASPWRSLAKVNAGAFACGDKIRLKSAQTWNESLKPPTNGCPGNPIVYTSYGDGAPPKITNETASGSTLTDRSHIVIDGLEFLIAFKGGVLSSGIYAERCSDIVIQNSRFNGSVNQQTNGIRILDCPRIKILGNTIDFMQYGIFIGTKAGGGFPYTISRNQITRAQTGKQKDWDCIKLTGHTAFTGGSVSHNDLSQCSEDGIDALFQAGVLIEHNVIHDAGPAYVAGLDPNINGIKISSFSGNVVRFNRINRIDANGTGTGIVAGNPPTIMTAARGETLIYGNIIEEPKKYCIYLAPRKGAPHRIKIYNNTCVGAGAVAIRIITAPGVSVDLP